MRHPSRDVILRHDVDLSLDAALRMAELEAEAGAAATYFLMTRSEFYNLDAPSGVEAIERLRELGHRVGLHAVWPAVAHDDRFDPVLAWHNPDPEYMRDAGRGLVNVMEAPWADVYRSDSNQHWRQGARTRSSRRAGSSGSSCSPTRRSGRIRAARCARRCSRCSTPSGSAGSFPRR